MKNLFYKIMTVFNSPIKPLTLSQQEELRRKIKIYQDDIFDYTVKIAFSENDKELLLLSINKTMAQERLKSLKIKLIKSCFHVTEELESEELMKALYTNRLLKFIHE